MQAIVSILDEKYSEVVKNLWSELDEEFGIKSPYEIPIPHFSYLGAKSYNFENLCSILSEIALNKYSFNAVANGLGVFDNIRKIIYVPVEKTLELTDFHSELWYYINNFGVEPSPLYNQLNWIPHITLACADIEQPVLSQVLRYLSNRINNWEIRIDNISLIKSDIRDENDICSFKFKDYAAARL